MNQNRIKLKGIETGSVDRSYKKYIRHQLQGRWKIDTRFLFIAYAGCSMELMEEIREEVKKYIDFDYILMQKASATVSSNSGTGTVGLMFLKKGKGNNM